MDLEQKIKAAPQKELMQVLKLSRPLISDIQNGKRALTPEQATSLEDYFTAQQGEDSIRIHIPQKHLDKFKQVFLYILQKVGAKSNVGETVLYKLLYFIDFDFYEKYEEQLIGATYIKNQYGPTPMEFKKIVKRMEGKDLTKIKDKYFQYPQTKYFPLRKVDLRRLKAHEIKLVDEVLEKLSDMDASQISRYSHNDVPWLTTEDGQTINYETVFYRTPQYSVRSYGEKDV